MAVKKILTCLLFVVALSSLFFQLQFAKKTQPLNKYNDEYPDIYIKAANILQLNESGLPDLRVKSPLLNHYLKSNAIDMLNPHITVYQLDRPPWHINANKGKAMNNLQTIYLWGAVHAKQAADKHNPSTTLLTSQITFFSLSKIIFTDQAITLLRPGLKVQSIGAHANIKTSKITLSSNAQAYYDFSHKK